MTSRFAALIHKNATHRKQRIIPGVTLATATLVAVLLFLVTSASTQSASSGCSSLAPVSLTASAHYAVEGTSESASADCSFYLEVSSLSPLGSEERPVGSEPCIVTASPYSLSGGAGLSVTPAGNCSGAVIRWRVYPVGSAGQGLPGGGVLASSSGQSSAYAYLVGKDFVGVDMIKNWSRATWTHNSNQVLTMNSSQQLWGTTHKIHILDLYLGDGWTVEYRNWGKTRHSDSRVEAWSIGHFHVHIPALPDARAQTRSELHAQANAAFYCDFELRWVNSYAFKSDSECARN